MPKVLVLFHSQTGSTAAVADAIAEGAETVKFTEVELRRIVDVAPPTAIDADDRWKSARSALARKYRTLESVESLAHYDALIFGGSVHDGIISRELSDTLDQAAALARRGALVDKVGSAFGPGAMLSGDGEPNVMPMLLPLMRFGMIIVPPGFDAAASTTGQSSAVAAVAGTPAAAGDLSLARQLGARVATVAEWVRHAKSHEAHGHTHGHTHGHSHGPAHEHSHGHSH